MALLSIILPLLALLTATSVATDPEQTDYDKQVIAVLQDDSSIVQQTTDFVYKKAALSYGATAVVKWNPSTTQFESVHNQLTPLGENSLLQLIGKGSMVGEQKQFAGFSPEMLASSVFKLPHDGLRIAHIQLIATNNNDEGKPYLDGEFVSGFLTSLATLTDENGVDIGIDTSVSSQSALISFDSTGEELTGTFTEDGIDWQHGLQATKVVGSTLEDDQVTTEILPLSEDRSWSFCQICQHDSTNEVILRGCDSGCKRSGRFSLSEDVLYDTVDKAAQNVFGVDSPASGGASIRNYLVRERISSDPRKTHYVIKEIREIGGPPDLVDEIRFYSGSGRSRGNVYYRYGDWVLQMNTDDFMMTLVGIILSEDIPNENGMDIPAGTILNSNTDPSDVVTDIKHLDVESIPAIGDQYSEMNGVDSNFFLNIVQWIYGRHQYIGTGTTEMARIARATSAQRGLTMFLSEAIRNPRVYFTNIMGLDLFQKSYITPKSMRQWFSSHPMAQSGASESETRSLIAGSFATWLRNLYGFNFESTSGKKLTFYASNEPRNDLVTEVEDANHEPSASIRSQVLEDHFTREVESNFIKPETSGSLSSTDISTEEIGVTANQVESFSSSDRLSLPLRASLALASDLHYIANLMNEAVRTQEETDGTRYSIVENSVQRADSQMTFRVIDDSEQERELTVRLDEDDLRSDEMLDDLGEETEQFRKNVCPCEGDDYMKFLKLYTTVMGLGNAIGALENGDITNGVVGILRSVYGFGKIFGINKLIAKEAGKVLGGFLSPRFAKVLEKIPIIDTINGVYDVVQDILKHTVIGYIDAGFDALTTALGFFAENPIVDAVIMGLQILKSLVDDFYNDIKKELDKLPPGASVGAKVLAVLKGIAEGFLDFLEEWTLPGQIIGAIINSHKLNEQYDKDREFLRQLSDYQNYFKVIKENGTSAKEVSFASGQDSWNGGDITFWLGENGISHLSMQEALDANGQHRTIDTYPDTGDTTDIVMGIGESHNVAFKTVTVKIFWFIPVDRKRIISGLNGEHTTLHGTYYGNSRNNTFFAVQELPPDVVKKLGYQLKDYSYHLYGGDGNDTFYLGPQKTYVEGNEGADNYFVNETATHADINNRATDGQTDLMIFTADYAELSLSRKGNTLHLQSTSGQDVCIQEWFTDVLHQHMTFKTGDGFLFDINVDKNDNDAVQMVPYALTKAGNSKGATLDVRPPGLPWDSVITLEGSDYNDTMYGNDLDNQFLGGKGDDFNQGGNGSDTYHLNEGDGWDVIDNYATDSQYDFLMFDSYHRNIIAQVDVDEEDLHLYSNATNIMDAPTVTIKKWFTSQQYQHMYLVSSDAVVFNISGNCSADPILHQLSVDMEFLDPKVLVMSPDELNVIGSDEADNVTGNSRNNYFSLGKGNDTVRGGEGQDNYVMNPEDGDDTIQNFALDVQNDTLLLRVKWTDVQLYNESMDLVLSVRSQNISVRLERWFKGVNFQHLLVRCIDGIVFQLPTTTENLVKVPVDVDKSNSSAGIRMTLQNMPWLNVTKVIGTQFDDTIDGSTQDSIVDPGPGQATMRGGDGKDTYVIKPTYHPNCRIHNYAKDQMMDTLSFEVPYTQIVAEKHGCSIKVSSNMTSGPASVTLVNYMLNNESQHLTVASSDGVSFVLVESADYHPLPLTINKVDSKTGQFINLTNVSRYQSVQTVYGAEKHPNCLIGHDNNITLYGGKKGDTLRGANGSDTLKGGAGNDILIGGRGADVLDGGDGNDTLIGDEGNDILSPGLGYDSVNGGGGMDITVCIGDPVLGLGSIINLRENVSYCSNGSVASLTSIEGAYGSQFNDTLIGSDEDNVLAGQAGNDTIIASLGYDILNGGRDSDQYDLSEAHGTKVIVNYAPDETLDFLLLPFANKTLLRYEKSGDHLIIRLASNSYQFSRYLEMNRPTIILHNWYKGPRYQHLEIHTADSVIVNELLQEYSIELYSPLTLGEL